MGIGGVKRLLRRGRRGEEGGRVEERRVREVRRWSFLELSC